MSYTHLTKEERYQIDHLRGEGFSQVEIAERLDRSPSTVSREIERNKGEREWRACQANEKARTRLIERGKNNARKISQSAWEFAKIHLINDQWSPEQIAGLLKLEGCDGISHEAIYQRIYADKKAGGKLFKNLRCQKLRRRRYASNRIRKPKICNRVGIENRPAIVEQRKRIGDWEGDTIIGAACKGAIVSAVDRVSRFTLLAKVETKSAEGVAKILIKKLKPLKELSYTMTLDNGGEFCLHEIISKTLDINIYFATPYCSWERGTNENTNGLVRQYFKKTMNFDKITDSDVQLVAHKLNHRPRKCLGYKTPYEIFSKRCKEKGVALRI
jgi:IS30 family transposase